MAGFKVMGIISKLAFGEHTTFLLVSSHWHKKGQQASEKAEKATHKTTKTAFIFEYSVHLMGNDVLFWKRPFKAGKLVFFCPLLVLKKTERNFLLVNHVNVSFIPVVLEFLLDAQNRFIVLQTKQVQNTQVTQILFSLFCISNQGTYFWRENSKSSKKSILLQR